MTYSEKDTKILFVYSTLSSFVRADLEILQKHFNVRKMKAETFFIPRKGRDPLVFLKMLRRVLWADIGYAWFANVNALFMMLFCKLLRKRSLIVVGGYDVVHIPEIDYGNLKSSRGRIATKFTLECATRVLAFSMYAKYRVLSVTRKANVCVMPLGCNTNKFKPAHEKKDDLVITVCYVDKDNIARKGLKTFVESARLLPDIKFAIIGAHLDDSINYLKSLAPSNVHFTGYVSDKELVRWYQKAKVYCQLSYEEGEGAGGALGEAMSSECVPIISEKAVALKETARECAVYVPYGDAEATAKAIELSLQASPELGIKARQRIKEFSLEKRERALIKLIKCL